METLVTVLLVLKFLQFEISKFFSQHKAKCTETKNIFWISKKNLAKDDQIGTYLDSWIAFSFENIVQRRAKRREQGAALTV